MTDDLRRQFRDALKHRRLGPALAAARALAEQQPAMTTWSFLRKSLAKIPAAQLGLKPLRVALLSSFSIEFIHDALIARGLLDGLSIDIYQPGFRQYHQELLDPESGLVRFRPDVVLLAVEGKHLVPDLYLRFSDLMERGGDAIVAEAEAELNGLVTALRQHCDATLLIHNFDPPEFPSLGILDGHVGTGQKQLVDSLNDRLYQLARRTPGVFVVDYAGLVRRFGSRQWFDLRLEHYAQAPIALPMLPHLAAEYTKSFRALTGKTKKCLVVDLDNTLWGGVVGEDGPDGIRLGPDYPGNAFVAFQQAILELSKRGVILAVASKNNPDDVDAVFDRHPHTVLRKEHFAHAEIHWGPKSRSLVSIAEKLGIGLEHVVFVDDNPVECDEVQSALPMVRVLQLPKQPERYVQALLDEGLFDSLRYSSEDRQRGDLYRRRAQAEQLRTQSVSLEEFYRRLAMRVSFQPVGPASLARAAQLTQRTNQFNLTTLRYSEAEIGARLRDPDWLVTAVQVRDRFGDNGIVGLMMARQQDGCLEVDTFLLSCRVIGRTIETAMLARLCRQAVQRGLKTVRGRIVPTKKNAPARDLYQQHGFHKIAESDTGETVWSLELNERSVSYPTWIEVDDPRTATSEAA